MQLPNFTEEKKLWQKGYQGVVGLDEVGRGPLAGPVVAAAIFLEKNCRVNLNINDSKKLSEKKREEYFTLLTSHPSIIYGVGIVSEKIIDKINILEATKLAMQKAIENLKLTNVDFLLIDGTFKINSSISQASIIKGDQKVFSIAAASIIAKVTRDRLMQKMHKKYPQYGFHLHKGYGTSLHIENIQKFGPCKIHRKSFQSISNLFERVDLSTDSTLVVDLAKG